MPITKKNVAKIAGILFAALLVWRVVALVTRGGEGNSMRDGRPPVAVTADSVRTAGVQEVRQFTGTVFPFYQYVLAPKVAGRIVEVRKRIGDFVRAGEVIARIDDAEYQQAVREAAAALKTAQAALVESRSSYALATGELERVQSLQEKGIASPSELDAALTAHNAQKSKLELSTAQVEQREALLKTAQIRLSYTVLAAAEAGLVGERFTDEGSLLAPNSPVVTVIGIDRVIIRTTIIERDYGRIANGQFATLRVDAYPAHEFTGRVARIAPLLQEAARVAQMEIEVANDSLLLKPGMFARIQVVLAEKQRAQVVPARSLVSREGETGVFLVDPEKHAARYVPVQPGIVTETVTEILAPGLTGLVVTSGQHLLEDGSPVIVAETGSPAPSDGPPGVRNQANRKAAP